MDFTEMPGKQIAGIFREHHSQKFPGNESWETNLLEFPETDSRIPGFHQFSGKQNS